MNAFTPHALLSAPPRGWQASLDLRVERRGGRSALTRRQHRGPLRVQKALYPEGDGVCQVLLLHPPAGIAGGDELRIALAVGSGAHAQITTPGAGKWYRSDGATAHQTIHLDVADGAVLEWLPQEAIVFDRALALTTTTVTLAPGGKAIGWDILCLGRTARGERFDTGRFRQRLRLQRPGGAPLWRESLDLQGADAAMASAVGLGGHTVFGTLWIAGRQPDAALNEALRGIACDDGLTSGVTALPDATVVRVLAHSTQAARRHLEAAWATARRHLLGLSALTPRIWST